MRAASPMVLVLLAACASNATAPELGSAGDAGSRELFLQPSGGHSLDGWSVLGGADFELLADADGVRLVGSAEDMGRNSFLYSDAEYGDFELELELRIEPGGNSGVQLRSAVDLEEDGGLGRLWGYQIEVDTSERAWSGGLYDEGRRGWLDPLEGREEARAAFRNGEWNHYRILCEGARIRSWVNGIACADFVDAGDDLTLRGRLALQVHSGQRAFVEWRGVRLREL